MTEKKLHFKKLLLLRRMLTNTLTVHQIHT